MSKIPNVTMPPLPPGMFTPSQPEHSKPQQGGDAGNMHQGGTGQIYDPNNHSYNPGSSSHYSESANENSSPYPRPSDNNNNNHYQSESGDESTVSLFMTRTRGYQAKEQAPPPAQDEAPARDAQLAQKDKYVNTGVRGGSLANETSPATRSDARTATTNPTSSAARAETPATSAPSMRSADGAKPATTIVREAGPNQANRAPSEAGARVTMGVRADSAVRITTAATPQTVHAETAQLTASQGALRPTSYEMVDMRMLPKWLTTVGTQDFAANFERTRRRVERGNSNRSSDVSPADLLEPVAFTGQLIDD